MADIIGSRSKASQLIMKQFKDLVNKVNKKYTDAIISPITITLGDEFQGVVNSLTTGIEIIIQIEEMIISQGYSFKLRYVLEYGKIDTKLNKTTSYEMLGEGLIKAREKLNSLKKNKNDRFYFNLMNDDITFIFENIFGIYQSVVDKWGNRDKELLKNFIKYEDYKLVASKMGKDTSLIWRRQQTLYISNYFRAKLLIAKFCELYG